MIPVPSGIQVDFSRVSDFIKWSVAIGAVAIISIGDDLVISNDANRVVWEFSFVRKVKVVLCSVCGVWWQLYASCRVVKIFRPYGNRSDGNLKQQVNSHFPTGHVTHCNLVIRFIVKKKSSVSRYIGLQTKSYLNEISIYLSILPDSHKQFSIWNDLWQIALPAHQHCCSGIDSIALFHSAILSETIPYKYHFTIHAKSHWSSLQHTE